MHLYLPSSATNSKLTTEKRLDKFSGSTDELETHSGDPMTAEMTHAELSNLNLETGQEVYVTPCNIHVFGSDEHALEE